MNLTPDEYRVLSSATMREGTYESDPFLKRNPVEIKSLLKKGLISRKQDSEEWSCSDEFFYEITSAGRLELNLYEKANGRKNAG